MNSEKRRAQPRFLGLLLLLYICAGLLYALAQRDVGNKAYEVFRFKAIHAEKAQSTHRILLTGGSNVIWGFRSQMLQQLTGVPTTNFGLEREGDDPAALRRLILSLVRAGDTVVYSSVTFWHTDPYSAIQGQALLLAAGLVTHENLYERLKYNWYRYWAWTPGELPLVETLPRLYRRYIAQEPSPLTEDFNEFGDIKDCMPEAVTAQDYVPPPDLEPYLAQMLEYRQQLHERGAELVIDPSWLYVKTDERSRWLNDYQPMLDRFNRQFLVTRSSLNDVLLTDVRRFCNTCNHLTDANAVIRTQTLAAFLTTHLPHSVFVKDAINAAAGGRNKG